jgi:hypothetical protein
MGRQFHAETLRAARADDGPAVPDCRAGGKRGRPAAVARSTPVGNALLAPPRAKRLYASRGVKRYVFAPRALHSCPRGVQSNPRFLPQLCKTAALSCHGCPPRCQPGNNAHRVLRHIMCALCARASGQRGGPRSMVAVVNNPALCYDKATISCGNNGDSTTSCPSAMATSAVLLGGHFRTRPQRVPPFGRGRRPPLGKGTRSYQTQYRLR